MKIYKTLLKKSKKMPTPKADAKDYVQETNLVYAISKQPVEILEIIQVLIIHHATINGHNINDGLTYHGKLYNNGRGVSYTIHHLPSELVNIIILYLNLCIGDIYE
jgi:hypothetical protein